MKKLICLCITLVMVASIFALPANAYKPAFKHHAKGVILYNVDSDTIVYEYNADKRLYPASLTKIMVAILLVEKCKNLKKTKVTISEKIYRDHINSDAVCAGFTSGQRVTCEDLLAYTVVMSCADAAAAIAEYVSGSTTAFVKLMNEKAAQIGMTNTHFVNADGLHSDKHYSTARDLCILTKYAMQYKAITKMTASASFEASDGSLVPSTNYLLSPSYKEIYDLDQDGYKEAGYYYEYATGFKTGFTDEAGRCLASTATKDGSTYICIVLGCPGQENQVDYRYEFFDTIKLLEWAYNGFEYKMLSKKSEVVDELAVKYSWQHEQVALKAKDEVFALIPVDADLSSVSTKVTYLDRYKNGLEAPVKKGMVVGKIDYYYGGNLVASSKLVTNQNIKSSFVLKAYTDVKDFLATHSYIIFILLIIIAVVVIFIIAVNVKLNAQRKKNGQRQKFKKY